jgi:DNA polymerase-3 subunit alpha
MGIEVLGPDVNESRENFTPVLDTSPIPNLGEERPPTASTVELIGRIRFGLAAIKGVGDSAAQKILEERKANGEYADFHDFIHRVDNKSVNRRALECLVKSGAFDFTEESRGSIFHRLDSAINEAATRQRDLSMGQESFFDVLQEDVSNAPAEEVKADPTKAFSQSDMLRFEKELLGFYISGHPLDDFHGLANALDTHSEEVLPELEDRTDFRICGVASSVTKKLSRRDNRMWAFFNLATRTGTIQLNCYADAYAEYGQFLENEALVMVVGSVLNRTGDIRFSVREIEPLERSVVSLIKKITWVLKPGAETNGFLHDLRGLLDKQHGSTLIAFGFLDANDHVAIASASNALKWKVSVPYFKRLRRHKSIAGCLIETDPIKAAEPRKWGKRNGW